VRGGWSIACPPRARHGRRRGHRSTAVGVGARRWAGHKEGRGSSHRALVAFAAFLADHTRILPRTSPGATWSTGRPTGWQPGRARWAGRWWRRRCASPQGRPPRPTRLEPIGPSATRRGRPRRARWPGDRALGGAGVSRLLVIMGRLLAAPLGSVVSHESSVARTGFSHTEMWFRLSRVKGPRCQSPQRSRNVSPARRAMRSSSDGQA
jgi:hypothetical protein